MLASIKRAYGAEGGIRTHAGIADGLQDRSNQPLWDFCIYCVYFTIGRLFYQPLYSFIRCHIDTQRWNIKADSAGITVSHSFGYKYSPRNLPINAGLWRRCCDSNADYHTVGHLSRVLRYHYSTTANKKNWGVKNRPDRFGVKTLLSVVVFVPYI